MSRMTSCRACGGMIAETASACPRCGAIVLKSRSSVVAVGLIIMLVIAILYVLSQRYW
jgi:predicted nucleic acid-binding Zn ribbon protein